MLFALRALLLAFALFFASTSLGQNLPSRVDTTKDLLSQTVAVVEGDVSQISYSYDSTLGPRTNVTFNVKSVPVGEFPLGNTSFQIIGGPLPNGNLIAYSEVPHFVLGGEYIFFSATRAGTSAPRISARFSARFRSMGERFSFHRTASP